MPGVGGGQLAEGVGFEPTLGLLLGLISSQVPSTTQPPFHRRFDGQLFRTRAGWPQADSPFGWRIEIAA